MYKFLFLIIGLQIVNCEKPLPQQPKVISSHTYHDTIPDSIVRTDSTPIAPSADSLQLSDTKEVSEKVVLNDNYVTYTNAAGRIVHILYEPKGENRQIKLIFPEQNISEIINETSYKSNTYIKEDIKWETVENHRTGKLTVFGTWFDFIIKD